MDNLRAIHNEAMDIAQMAQIVTRQGDIAKAEKMFTQAFEKEHEAAMIAYDTKHPQPGLAILLQSAAHLAVNCGKPREAEKLIGLALSCDTPEEIRHDLRTLLASLDNKDDTHYETYTIKVPSGDKGILNALDLMLNRLGCSMKKIAVL